jgi:DHA2 family multidrug resistance protein
LAPPALGCFLSFVTGVGAFTTIYLTPLFLGYVRDVSAIELRDDRPIGIK